MPIVSYRIVYRGHSADLRGGPSGYMEESFPCGHTIVWDEDRQRASVDSLPHYAGIDPLDELRTGYMLERETHDRGFCYTHPSENDFFALYRQPRSPWSHNG